MCGSFLFVCKKSSLRSGRLFSVILNVHIHLIERYGYALVVEGHVLLEVTSMGEKIFVTLMQLIDETKYAAAFQQVLTELGIPYTVEGPFPKRLTKHALPTR